ncbi:helix-turn-helix domain-containing protein [Nocardia sp. NPDC051570]|uniref:helix-turn-helix domain-containing protein n=1 Tax=Nocardia sp. NPDC051570 TaxID=3364324 RepID=UPI0037B28504
MDVLGSGRLTVGEQLEMRRRRRGLSRKVVADLVGRSAEWLRLVESGRRKLDSIEVLTRLADVLAIADPTDLIDWQIAGDSRLDTRGDDLDDMRRAIMEHPWTSADYGVTQADWTLKRCDQAWSRSRRRFSIVARELPPILSACRAAHGHLQDRRSGELLVYANHLARRLLTARGEHNLAATVADRSMAVSAALRDSLRMSASAWHVAQSLAALCYTRESHDYALAAAHRIGEKPPADIERATLWGALHLLGARSAASARDISEALRLLAIAQHLVDNGIDHQKFGIAFGPIELGIARVRIALTQHDPERAIRLAAALDIPEQYPVGCRSEYHIDLACAYLARDDDVAAAFALSKAASISPEDIRYNTAAHRCLQYLLRNDNHLIRREVAAIAALAEAD